MPWGVGEAAGERRARRHTRATRGPRRERRRTHSGGGGPGGSSIAGPSSVPATRRVRPAARRQLNKCACRNCTTGQGQRARGPVAPGCEGSGNSSERKGVPRPVVCSFCGGCRWVGGSKPPGNTVATAALTAGALLGCEVWDTDGETLLGSIADFDCILGFALCCKPRTWSEIIGNVTNMSGKESLGSRDDDAGRGGSPLAVAPLPRALLAGVADRTVGTSR